MSNRGIMGRKTSMTVSGLEDIERLMKVLPRSNARKIKRGALRAGGRPIVKQIREEIDAVPDHRLGKSGKDRFKRSIGVVTSKDRTFEGKVYAGPRYAGVKHTAPDFHLFEFGTDDRKTKDGRDRGRIEATPMVRPGWEKKRVEAVEVTRRELVERTIKEAEKLRRR